MKKHLKFFLLLSALMVPWAANAQMLSTDYAFTTGIDSTQWKAMPTDAVQIIAPSAGDYGVSTVQNIGFTYSFAGTDYTQFSVNADGMLRLGSTVVSTNRYSSSFGTTNLSYDLPKVCAMGCDGYMASNGYAKTWLEGTAGNQVRVVEVKTSTYSSTSRDGILAFQFQLYEATGEMRVVYGAAPSINPAVSQQIGMASSETDIVLFNTATASMQPYSAATSDNNPSGSWPAAWRWYSMVEDPDVCHAPGHLAISNILTDGATFTWNGGDASQWAVYLDGEYVATVYDSTYTFTDLTTSTSYLAAVRAICGAGDTSATPSTTFRTACGTIASTSMPWTENFSSWENSSNYFDPCWTKLNYSTSYASYPYVTTGTNPSGVSGDKYIYFYPYRDTTPQFAVTPPFESLDGMMVSFWVKGSNYCKLGVGTLSSNTDTSSYTQLLNIQSIPSNNEWTYYEVQFGNTTDQYIAFRGGLNYSSGYSIYIDDIRVAAAPNCPRPTAVSVSGVEAYQVDLHVADSNSSPNYMVYIYTGTTLVDSVAVNDTLYTLTDLTPNTEYRLAVTAICPDGNSHTPHSVSFRTACVPVESNDLPWTENFESFSTTSSQTNIPCWAYIGNGSGYNDITSVGGTGNSSSRCYRFYPNNTNPLFVILPAFEDGIANLVLDVAMRAEGATQSGNLVVGYITDINNASTFVPTQTFPASTHTTWTLETDISFAGAPEGARIAIADYTVQGNYYWWIDNLTVHTAPDCTRPSITLSDLTPTSVTVNLADANDVNDYMLSWGTDSTEVNGTSYNMDNLTPATTYTLTAVTLCSDGSRTASVSVTFTTPCEAIATLPWTENFDNVSTGEVASVLPCWNQVTPGSSSVNYIRVQSSYPHSGSNHLHFQYSAPTGAVIALPPFEEELSTLELSFWHRPESNTNASCGTFKVGYLADGVSASSFVAVGEWAYNDFSAAEYRQEAVTFAGAPEGARMAFMHITNTANWYWFVDDIDVHEAPSCLRPNGVAVSGIGTTEAHVTIADSSYAGNYRIDFVNGSDTLTVTVYDTAYDATGLNASSAYTVYVRTICSDGSLTSAVSASFRTECDVISTLPWHETFQSYTAESGAGQASSITNLPCWTIHQTYQYYSFIQNSWNHEEGGANAIRIYAGDSYPTYMVLPPFDEDLENLMFSFWSNFDNSTLHMVVGYMTDADQTSTFVPLDTIWAPTEADRNQWVYNEVLFPSGAEGRIAYRFYGSGTSNVRLDDYTVMLAPSCVRPQSVSVDSVTTTTADITIVDPTNNGNYQYTLMMGSTVVDSGIVSSTAISLTGLNPSTTYIINVYSICSDGNLTMPNSATFTTECAAITTLPWTEGFEGYAVTSSQVNIPCWNNVRPSTSAYVCITDASTRVHSGSRSMRFSGYAATPNMMVLPEFADDISGLEMSFWSLAEGGNSGWLRVGYVTDPTDTTTFVQMDAFPETQTTYTQQFVTFAGAPAGARIAIQQRTPGSNNMWWWIDDIDVHVAPNCTRPVVSVTNVTAYSADVNLMDANGVNSYVLVTATDTLTVGNSYTLTGLTPSTTYTLSAATLCSDGDTTTFATTTFTTPCAMLSASADMPLSQDFEGLPSSAAIDIPCWTRIGRGTSYPSWPHTTSATGPNGTGNMVCYFYSDANANEYLITPPIDTLSNLMVSFYMRQISSGVGITVGVMADPNVDSTFVPIQTFVPTVSGTWELCEVPLAGHDNDGHYVAFRIRPATSGGVYMDNVVIDQMPSCMHPIGVTASNVTTSSAHIVVDDPTYVGSYRMTLTSTVDTVVVNLTDTAYDATGLANSTLYTVTVAAVCDDDSLTSSVTTTFTTLCDAISTLPWHEDFNSYGSYYTSYASRMTVDMIPCWDFIGSNSGAYMFLTDASNSYGYDASSGYSLSFYPGQSGRRNYVVLPPFSSDISTLEMSCWTRPEGTSASSGSFDFGYMTDGNDTTTFVVLQHYNYSDFNNAYGEVSLTFAGAPAGSRIAMRHNTAASNYYWYVDEIDIHQAPSCSRPSVTIDSIDATSVTVHFSDLNNVGNYLVNLGGTTTVVNDTVHTFTGLHSSTGYTLEAATLCPGGDTTSFTSVSFYTSCVMLTRADLPMVETFDNYAPSSTADIHPCWSRYNYYNSNVYPYPYSYYHYGTSGNCMYFYPGLVNAAQYLVLPAYDTVANTNINFWVYRTTNYPLIEVGVMTDPADTSTFTSIQVCEPTTLSAWVEFDVDLNSYTGTGNYVALRAYCNTNSGYSIYVDQVTLSPISTCPRPTSVAVSNITESSADVTITDPANSGHYRLWWSDGTMVDSTDTYATTYSLSGLTASSTYSLQVSSICADGSLTHRTSTTFRTLCDAIASSALPWVESFENFANNTRDTAADFSCWTFIHPHGENTSSNGYCQVTNSYPVTGVNSMRFSGYASTPMVAILPEFAGSIADMSMTFHLRAENSNAYSGSTNSPGAIRVGYITDITDSSTFVQTARFECTSGNYGTMHLDSATFTGAPAGARIAIEQVNNNTNYWWWIDDITVSNSNGTAYYTVSATSADATMGTATVTPSGRVEEGTTVTATATPADGYVFVNWTVGGTQVSTANPYTFTVTANTALVANFDVDATCDVPTAVAVSNVGLTSATISWTAAEGQDSWEVHITGTGYDQTFATTTNPYTVTGLSTDVTYTVTVRAICSATSHSEWSATATFTTTSCQPVTNVNYSDVTTSGATITWTAPAGVSNFELEYGASGFASGTGTRVETSTNSATLTGLTAGMAYDVYVRSVCGNGAYSPWSNATPFTTEDDQQGIDDVNNAAIALFPNPATTTVTLTGIDGQATVTIVDMNGRVNGEWKVESGNLTIDLTGYAQGAYFVRITGEQLSAIRKLIVK